MGKSLATFTLETEVRFASAGDRDAFTRELADEGGGAIGAVSRRAGAAGRLFRFMLGAYPAITKTNDRRRPRRPRRFRMRSRDHECQEKPFVRKDVRSVCSSRGGLEGDHRGRGAAALVLRECDLRAG